LPICKVLFTAWIFKKLVIAKQHLSADLSTNGHKCIYALKKNIAVEELILMTVKF